MLHSLWSLSNVKIQVMLGQLRILNSDLEVWKSKLYLMDWDILWIMHLCILICALLIHLLSWEWMQSLQEGRYGLLSWPWGLYSGILSISRMRAHHNLLNYPDWLLINYMLIENGLWGSLFRSMYFWIPCYVSALCKLLRIVHSLFFATFPQNCSLRGEVSNFSKLNFLLW